MKLEDFESALNPDQFQKFVSYIRDLESSHGLSKEKDDFGMSKSEKEYRFNIRRDVVAARDMVLGTIISEYDVVLKRSSAQDSFKSIAQVKGKKLKSSIKAGMPISAEYIER